MTRPWLCTGAILILRMPPRRAAAVGLPGRYCGNDCDNIHWNYISTYSLHVSFNISSSPLKCTSIHFQTWQDMKSKSKKMQSVIRRQQNMTGGGPPPPPLSDETCSILNTISEAALSGHCDSSESVVIFSGKKPNNHDSIHCILFIWQMVYLLNLNIFRCLTYGTEKANSYNHK